MKIKKLFLLTIFVSLFFFSGNVYAAEFTASGTYGLVKCTEVYNGTSSNTDCAYVASYTINGTSTQYTSLEKSTQSFLGDTINYKIASRLFLFANYDFKSGNYYTLNYSINTGSYVVNTLSDVSKNKMTIGTGSNYTGADYDSVDLSTTFNNSTYEGIISITFKANSNFNTIRFIIDCNNYNYLFRNMSNQYNQGVRVYLINGVETKDNTAALLGQLAQQNQTIINQNNQINNSINNIDSTIKDDNVDEPKQNASDFFTNFESNTHGLSGVITAPLGLLQNLTASTCTPLRFNLPIVHNEVILPCMKPIYQEKFGAFFTLWQLLTTGLISYNVLLNFYKKVRDLQNPNNDRIEVLNL